jgi:hypothetical protein
MKEILLMCLFLFEALAVLSQNEEIECIKTVWPLSDGYQIDTYNSEDQKIQMIRVKASTQDTTQWHVYQYNENGLRTEYYSLIETNYAPFKYGYIYDENDELIGKVKWLDGEPDTTLIESSSIPVNEFGDPLYEELVGNIGYLYDDNGNQIERYVYTDKGDTSSVIYKSYNQNEQLETLESYASDTLVIKYLYHYDARGLLVKEEEFNHSDELVAVTYNEYDSTRFNFRSYGTSYGTKWEMTFEKIDCEDIKMKKN